MKDLTSTSFGYLIGFLLPGMFGLYAFSYWFPQMGVLLQPILKADASVGPSVVFLFIAVGMGLCLGAVRYFLLQKGLYRKRSISKDIYKGLGSDELALHRALAEEHYRYHQFYGGCALALLIMFIGWAYQNLRADWHFLYVTLGFLAVELLLERSASDCFTQYVEKCNTMAANKNASPTS